MEQARKAGIYSLVRFVQTLKQDLSAVESAVSEPWSNGPVEGLREKTLGPEHSDVAKSLYYLAWLYRTQSRYGKAEPLYERALAIREKALGKEHSAVAESLNNLAELYYAQSKYTEAEGLFKKALAIRKKPSVRSTMK